MGLWGDISCSFRITLASSYAITWHVKVRLLLDGFLLWISLPEIGIGRVAFLLLLLLWLLGARLVSQLVDPVALKVLQQALAATKRPAHGVTVFVQNHLIIKTHLPHSEHG